jgi:lactobin A/cerein 7B family class IIb bacteriocin
MNLEKLNLVELNAQEVQETEGGILPLLAILAIDAVCLGLLTGAAHATIKHSK